MNKILVVFVLQYKTIKYNTIIPEQVTSAILQYHRFTVLIVKQQ
jgi:hypothetical protein